MSNLEIFKYFLKVGGLWLFWIKTISYKVRMNSQETKTPYKTGFG